MFLSPCLPQHQSSLYGVNMKCLSKVRVLNTWSPNLGVIWGSGGQFERWGLAGERVSLGTCSLRSQAGPLALRCSLLPGCMSWRNSSTMHSYCFDHMAKQQELNPLKLWAPVLLSGVTSGMLVTTVKREWAVIPQPHTPANIKLESSFVPTWREAHFLNILG